MADEEGMSALLDAVVAETEARREEAPTAEERLDEAAARLQREEAEARRRRPAWLGKGSAELMAGKGGRVSTTTDVERGQGPPAARPPRGGWPD